MSASLCYTPVTPKTEHYVDVVACQVRDDLTSLYGSYPIILNEANLRELRVLEAIYKSTIDNPYSVIIKIVIDNPEGIKLYESY